MSIEVILMRFCDVWMRCDVQGVFDCFVVDGEYYVFIGLFFGVWVKGYVEIVFFFEVMFEYDCGMSIEVNDFVIWFDVVSWMWCYMYLDGMMEIGCDCFQFCDDLIVFKDVYCKVWMECL